MKEMPVGTLYRNICVAQGVLFYVNEPLFVDMREGCFGAERDLWLAD